MVTPIKTLKQEQLTFIFNLETNKKKMQKDRRASLQVGMKQFLREGKCKIPNFHPSKEN